MQNNEFCFSIEVPDAAQPCCYSGDTAYAGANQDWAFQTMSRTLTFFGMRSRAKRADTAGELLRDQRIRNAYLGGSLAAETAS
ncbi:MULTISPECIES: hypothetical protein [Paraburkholderia]|uniref:hypothetical protein n=1 Tax=Paraburkholderia TaxID=1822464 RepID=UPI00025535D8|nr:MULTISPECIES: hypothetical protein [Paraburkholderia]MDR8396237.1 hypothetical protein [Paraburkholderia sp. USG1]